MGAHMENRFIPVYIDRKTRRVHMATPMANTEMPHKSNPRREQLDAQNTIVDSCIHGVVVVLCVSVVAAVAWAITRIGV